MLLVYPLFVILVCLSCLLLSVYSWFAFGLCLVEPVWLFSSLLCLFNVVPSPDNYSSELVSLYDTCYYLAHQFKDLLMSLRIVKVRNFV